MAKRALSRVAGVALATALMLGGATAHAGSVTGKHYTNFGYDLVQPIFPKNGTLAIYSNPDDATPIKVVNNLPVLDLAARKSLPCLNESAHPGWVQCSVQGNAGWIKRASFYSAAEAPPVDKWAFRYWLYIASSGMGGEETDMLLKAVPRIAYLVKPKQFENIFFIVKFDEQGFAISPKTGQKTGDRVFMAGKAAYLAPSDPGKRATTPWLLLNYVNDELNALCPSPETESCYSAVNLAPNWVGIKALNTTPSRPAPKNPGAAPAAPWFGAEQVAFARHADPVVPLNYTVPSDVFMKADGSAPTAAQHAANRAKPFCLVDCPPGANTISIDPKPTSY